MKHISRKRRLKALRRIRRWRQNHILLTEDHRDFLDASIFAFQSIVLAGVPNCQRRWIKLVMDSNKVLVAGGYKSGKTEAQKMFNEFQKCIGRGGIKFPKIEPFPDVDNYK